MSPSALACVLSDVPTMGLLLSALVIIFSVVLSNYNLHSGPSHWETKKKKKKKRFYNVRADCSPFCPTVMGWPPELIQEDFSCVSSDSN